MKIRDNQKHWTADQWDKFIRAFKNIKQGVLKGVEKPKLDDFADEHADAFKEKYHGWLVHTHGITQDHWGLLFFAWHRVFLNKFENRLRREEPSVTIPYWNAFKDPFPEELKKISDNEGECVWLGGGNLPDFEEPDWFTFQHNFEINYHGNVHDMLGGTVGRDHAPRDAAFWLHHAFVDRQWGHWFEKHNNAMPPAIETIIRGGDIVGDNMQVQDILHTPQLDYVYDNGIYKSILKDGSDRFSATLSVGKILCVKMPDEFYAKMMVYAMSPFAATLIMQHFPNRRPGIKKGLLPTETTYCNLITGKMDVPQSEAHVRFTKATSGENATYRIEAVNGTQLAEFTGLTDFTANNGEGATDYEMLYI